MSEQELIGAYTSGKISRRIFVRGLVAAGVSAAAAAAYAANLQPAQAAAPRRKVRGAIH